MATAGARRRSAGAIIVSREGTMCLLVKQKDGQLWSLPKGTCFDREPPETCMRREVLEETGVKLELLRHFVTGKHRWKRYMIFVVKLLDPVEAVNLAIHDDAEIDGVQWTPLDQVFRLALNRVTRDSLQHYLCCNPLRSPRSQFQHFGQKRSPGGAPPRSSLRGTKTRCAVAW